MKQPEFLEKTTSQVKSLGSRIVTRVGRRKLLIVGALLLVLFVGRLELTISGEFQVYPEHNADIRAAVEGLIVEIYVVEGQAVEEGALIARLDDRNYQAKKREIETQLSQKRSQWQLLLKGNREEEVDLARSELETAQTNLLHSRSSLTEAENLRAEKISRARDAISLAENQVAHAEDDLDRARELKKNGYVSEQRFSEIELEVTVRKNELGKAKSNLKLAEGENLQSVRRELALAENEVEEAKAKLEVLLAGTRPEELEAAKVEVLNLETQLEDIEIQLGLLMVASPISGIVTTERIREKKGLLIEQGALIAEVYDFKTIKADIYVPEKEFGDVVLGQPVTLKARAYPGQNFEGVVTAIAPRAVTSEDGLNRQMIRVTTEINNPELLLKPAMTGNAKIYAGKRSIFNLITRRLVRYLRVEFWSWW